MSTNELPLWMRAVRASTWKWYPEMGVSMPGATGRITSINEETGMAICALRRDAALGWEDVEVPLKDLRPDFSNANTLEEILMMLNRSTGGELFTARVLPHAKFAHQEDRWGVFCAEKCMARGYSLSEALVVALESCDNWQEITDATEKKDIAKLREISDRLSESSDSDTRLMAKRVQLAAAIIEVGKVGTEVQTMGGNDSLAIHAGGKRREHLMEAVESCLEMTAWLYPAQRFILTRWFDNEE